MNIKDNDTPILHTKETTEVTNKTTSVQTKPSSYNSADVDRTINARSSSNLIDSQSNDSSPVSSSNNHTGARVMGTVAVSSVGNKSVTNPTSTIKSVSTKTIRDVKSTTKRYTKKLIDSGTNKVTQNLEGSQEGSQAGYTVVESVRVVGEKSISSSSKSIKSFKKSKVTFRQAKNATQRLKIEAKAVANNRAKLKKIKGTNAMQKKLTKKSAMRKKLAKETAIRTKQTAKALVKALKYALEALKDFFVFICSSSVAFVVFLLCVALIVAIIASPFGIMVSNDDGSLTDVITEVMEEYHTEISELMANHDYDEINISGSAPDWKDVLIVYIAKYSDATADEATVFAEFDDVNANKLSQVFWDMCIIVPNFYNEPRTVVVNNPDDGSLHSVTVDNWILNIDISSSTAINYASSHYFPPSKMEIVNEFSSPEYDQMWDTLLEGIPMYALLDFGDFPFYDQTDYGHIPYGDGSIADSGCGPTAFAMVASYLTGTRITPVDVVSWCGNNFYVYGSGTAWGFFGAAADHYGITLERFTTDINVAVEALAQGKPVINAQGAGRFTSGGHFIVLRGLDSNGRILVYDPNNGDMDENHLSFSKAEISAGAGAEEYWIFTSDLVTGGNVARQVWNYFTRKGLSDEVTAGIIGNMMRECGGDTLNLDWDIYGSYMGQRYYGLCQWSLYYTPSIDGASVQRQCDHIWATMSSEFNNYGSNYRSGFNYSQFKRLGVEEAAVAFAVCYERPGYENNNYQLRRQNAMVAYNTFHR